MKRSNHPGEALALILAAALCAFTPGLAAQSRDTPPKQGEQQQDQQQNKTFSGKIEKLQNGQYALITGQTPEANYPDTSSMIPTLRKSTRANK